MVGDMVQKSNDVPKIDRILCNTWKWSHEKKRRIESRLKILHEKLIESLIKPNIGKVRRLRALRSSASEAKTSHERRCRRFCPRRPKPSRVNVDVASRFNSEGWQRRPDHADRGKSMHTQAKADCFIVFSHLQTALSNLISTPVKTRSYSSRLDSHAVKESRSLSLASAHAATPSCFRSFRAWRPGGTMVGWYIVRVLSCALGCLSKVVSGGIDRC